MLVACALANVALEVEKTDLLALNRDAKSVVFFYDSDNVDPDSYRSRIRRFDLGDALFQDFQTGELFADGLRNEVGLAFDRHGVLWGGENGADDKVAMDDNGMLLVSRLILLHIEIESELRRRLSPR
jgi:hypothetical protein